MTEEELMRLYAILQSVPGKTGSQRLNFLQDIGFNLAGQNPQFVEEQFVGEPEPELVNPVAQAYGKDAKWANIFGKIESGMDPDSAVAAAVKEGIIPKPGGFGDEANNPYQIARDYAITEAENEAKLKNWYASNEAASEKFGEKQSRLRSEFEADQPYTMQDLSGVSQFEAMGAPSVDDLLARRADQMRQGREALTASRAAAPAPRSTSRQGSIVAAQGAPPRKDIMQTPVLARAMRSTLDQRLAASKERMLPTERSEGALRRLAIMQMLNQ